MSNTFNLLSSPEVTMYLKNRYVTVTRGPTAEEESVRCGKLLADESATYVPVLSTVSERTPPWWHNIFTNGSLWFGDHKVTVPVGWPR